MRVVLLLAGWALFGVSLLLPAVREGGMFFSGTYKGWLCLVVSVPGIAAFVSGEREGVYMSLLGLSNVLMLASPALHVWGGRWAAQQKMAFLAAAIVVCLTKFAGGGPNTEYLVGYYVWCASFVAVAAALHFD
jgi:hypothetical protein